jgi:hypothetical protein
LLSTWLKSGRRDEKIPAGLLPALCNELLLADLDRSDIAGVLLFSGRTKSAVLLLHRKTLPNWGESRSRKGLVRIKPVLVCSGCCCASVGWGAGPVSRGGEERM